jgi:hypothetical protein
MGLRNIDTEHSQAEMGFWIGVDYWGQGFATEAGQAVIRFGFERLNLNRVHAHHMVRNPASGRVLEKLGMKREGALRQRVRKSDNLDLAHEGVSREIRQLDGPHQEGQPMITAQPSSTSPRPVSPRCWATTLFDFFPSAPFDLQRGIRECR